ncbi:PfkB family carbohydrate kinase [Demequina sp.]|uniref:PfkB family carbohydrate kinase n=1 Tax=Demequina sp. TaxID=2050685 RepID=UPI003A856BE2
MSPDSPRALFAGLTTLDVIQSVERVPAANQKIAALDFLVAAGGPATNAAVAFAHLGGTPTLATRLPQHPLADPIRADLAACGVGLLDHGDGSGPPVTASIMVTQATGERAVVSPSASAVRTDRAPVEPPSLDGVSAVLIDGYHPEIAVPLAMAARAAGVPVVMDAGSLKPHTASVVRAADIVIASDDLRTPHGSGAPEDVFAWLGSLGVETMAITRGSQPVLWRVRGAQGEVPVAPVPVVDTLGAGDFFHGTLAFRIALLGRDDARLADDLAWAADAMAPSLRTFGTRAWLRS